MYKLKYLIVFLLLAAMLVGCSQVAAIPAASAVSAPASSSQVSTAEAPPSTSAVSVPSPKEEYEFDATLPAPSLAENKISQKSENQIYVVLPKSYYASDKRYPVLYILHGYGENCQYIVQMIDRDQMAQTGEFILVGINGSTSQGDGSFYADSPVTGNWEKHVTQEVTAYVDASYRTVAKREARGLAGFSMGGSATVNIGLAHPDVFSAIYPISPGLFNKDGLKKAMNDWNSYSGFLPAYGAAFSPDSAANPPYHIPKFDSTQADDVIVQNWENGFGNLESKTKAYLEKSDQLAAIRIVWGKNDTYKWIPEGCAYFSELLKKYNIEHDTVVTNGRHSVDYKQLNNDMLPFFASKLQMEE